jgi:hypothetical protein
MYMLTNAPLPPFAFHLVVLPMTCVRGDVLHALSPLQNGLLPSEGTASPFLFTQNMSASLCYPQILPPCLYVQSPFPLPSLSCMSCPFQNQVTAIRHEVVRCMFATLHLICQIVSLPRLAPLLILVPARMCSSPSLPHGEDFFLTALAGTSPLLHPACPQFLRSTTSSPFSRPFGALLSHLLPQPRRPLPSLAPSGPYSPISCPAKTSSPLSRPFGALLSHLLPKPRRSLPSLAPL